mmetsp:Transcript_10620/g.24859  ORF Transcript_10620/g.24859 Transcript_10620/m.24859 type:complete len:190 (-) Transcript_10620:1349-1918(-)
MQPFTKPRDRCSTCGTRRLYPDLPAHSLAERRIPQTTWLLALTEVVNVACGSNCWEEVIGTQVGHEENSVLGLPKILLATQLGETHGKEGEEVAVESKTLETVGMEAEGRRNQALEDAAGERWRRDRERRRRSWTRRCWTNARHKSTKRGKMKGCETEEVEGVQQAVSPSVARMSRSMLSPRGQDIHVR